jgi:membrane protein
VATEADAEGEDETRPTLRDRATAAAGVANDRWDEARLRWPWLALPDEFVRRWASTNASVLAGHLAYRVFVFILPLLVLVVGLLGYASSTGTDLQEQGQSGMRFSTALASTMSSTGDTARDGRLQLVTFGGFALLLAASGLVKALQLVFATAWGVPVKSGKSRLAVLGRFLPGVVVILGAVALRQWLSRSGWVLTLSTEILNAFIDALALLGLSWVLPRRTTSVLDLAPGAVLGGAGLAGLHIAALVYFPSKIERASALYGTLGIALVALLYLFLVGQVLVASAIANTVWFDRRDILRPPPPDS